jgi:hypothetical protein
MKGIPLVGKGVVFPILEWPDIQIPDIDLQEQSQTGTFD